VHALEQFFERCLARGIVPILVHDSEAVRAVLTRTGVLDHLGEGFVADELHDALAFAGALLAKHFCRKGDCAAGAACLRPSPLPPREGNA
jgi:hypothetical protein